MGFGYNMRFCTDGGLDVIMRPVTEDDLPRLAEGISNYEVSRTMGNHGGQTVATERSWLERIQGDRDGRLWGVCVLERGAEVLIGTSGVHFSLGLARGTTGFGIFFREYWKKGIASACHRARLNHVFMIDGLRAVDSEVMRINPGSRKALESVGYVRIGTRHGYFFRDGAWQDVDLLEVVNPLDSVWPGFWHGREVPETHLRARERSLAALEWAAKEVKYF